MPRAATWNEVLNARRAFEELETFREGNYILATEEALSWFPAVRWWNA